MISFATSKSGASRLALHNTPMPVIAEQLGHAGTRMTERHYAHLTPGHAAGAMSANFKPLGILPQRNLASFEQLRRLAH